MEDTWGGRYEKTTEPLRGYEKNNRTSRGGGGYQNLSTIGTAKYHILLLLLNRIECICAQTLSLERIVLQSLLLNQHKVYMLRSDSMSDDK